jgi:hypothetical protein
MTNEKHPGASAKDDAPEQVAAQEPEPFRVAGSLRVLVSDEELEAGIAEARRHQAELFEAKMRSILE